MTTHGSGSTEGRSGELKESKGFQRLKESEGPGVQEESVER